MKKTALFLIAFVFAFAGCATQPKVVGEIDVPVNFLFSGEYQYFADAAVFFDCTSGRALPVSPQGEALIAERTYNGMKGDNWNGFIFMECYGRVEYLPSMEESQPPVQQLIIDSLVGFDHTVGCDPESNITGLFVANPDGDKSTLYIRPDYTFWSKKYSETDQKITESDGIWGKISNNEIAIVDTTVTPNIARKITIGKDFATLVSADSTVYKRVKI